jgi:hypothetical protein
MVRYAFAIGVAGLVSYGFSMGQQKNCGAARTEEEIARRRAAVTTARQINTAEAQGFPAARRYLPLAVLHDVAVPNGFDVQVSTDGESYTFSVKDTKDECHAAIFSDQKGLIYTAMPLR